MKRVLVLTSEGAGHPYRRTLQPAVLTVAPPAPGKKPRWWKEEDTHLFGISFATFFTLIYGFIA